MLVVRGRYQRSTLEAKASKLVATRDPCRVFNPLSILEVSVGIFASMGVELAVPGVVHRFAIVRTGDLKWTVSESDPN